MNEIQDLIGKAVELSRNVDTTEVPAVLGLWERAVTDIRKCLKFSVSDSQKALPAENETVLTVPKRKRGRPRKEKPAVLEKVKKPENDSNRRISRRTIVPSKRYPLLLSTILKPKAPDKCHDLKVESDQKPLIGTIERSTDKLVSGDSKSGDETEDNMSQIKAADSDNEDEIDDCGSGVKGSADDKKSALKRKKVYTPKKNQCTVCGKIYNNRSNLYVHMRLHDGRRPYSCSQCGKTFSVLSNKKRHEATHSGLKPFSCPHCSKCFTAKRSLLIHLRQHTGERPYKCKYCEKQFSQMGTLQSHIHIHEGIKKHLCDLCGKAFRQKSQMMVHLLRHEVSQDASKKKFKCELCSVCFVSKSDRDRHLTKHSGFRPYLCNLCPKAFTRMAYLKEHVKQHHASKQAIIPLNDRKCKICGFKNQNWQKYHEHMRRHEENGEVLIPQDASNLESAGDGDGTSRNSGEETVIFVVDQSAVDNLFMENVADQDGRDHSSNYIITPVVGNENSGLSEAGQHKLTLVQEGAIQFLQESQIADQPCQTLVITEEQLAQLQHMDVIGKAVDNSDVNYEVTTGKTSLAATDGAKKDSESSGETIHQDQSQTDHLGREQIHLEPGEVLPSSVSVVSEESVHRSDDCDEQKEKKSLKPESI